MNVGMGNTPSDKQVGGVHRQAGMLIDLVSELDDAVGCVETVAAGVLRPCCPTPTGGKPGAQPAEVMLSSLAGTLAEQNGRLRNLIGRLRDCADRIDL